MKLKKSLFIFIILIFIGIISKAFGFLRESVLAKLFGATSLMDTYNIALSVPGVLFTGIGTAFTTAFIPVYIKNKILKGEEFALYFASKIYSYYLFLSILVCIIGIVFAKYISIAFAPKFSPDQIIITASLTKILFSTAFLTIINGFCIGFLQANRKYIIPSFAAIPFNLSFIIIILLLNKYFGIYSLALGYALSVIAQVFILIPSINKLGFKFSLKWKILRDTEVAKFGLLVFLTFISTMLMQFNIIIGRVFLSGLEKGSISSLSYANRLIIISYTVVVSSIIVIAFPSFSRSVAKHEIDKLASSVSVTINGLILFLFPLIAIIIYFSDSIIRIIFERGAFDSNAAYQTSLALKYLSIGLLGYSLREVISRVFYSLENNITPMINSLLTVVINIILMLILNHVLGFLGIVLSIMISGYIGCIILFISLNRKISLYNSQILNSTVKIIISTIFLVLSLIATNNMLGNNSFGQRLLSQIEKIILQTVIGIIIYCTFLILLKVKEIELIKLLLFRKSKVNIVGNDSL